MNPDHLLESLKKTNIDPKVLEALEKQEQQYKDTLEALESEEPLQPPVTQASVVQGNPIRVGTQVKAPTISEEIAQIERELGKDKKIVGSMGFAVKSYLDDYGNETWYVKNVSNGHVGITDIETTINRSAIEDLLKFADLDKIRKSRNLREALDNPKGSALLIRLTPEEYLKEMRKAKATLAEVTRIKDSYAPPSASLENAIRPAVYSQLGKYKLGTNKDPELAVKGLTGLEFIEWAMTEQFTESEIEHLIGEVSDSQVKRALLAKKSVMNS
jgi:hypothetical protein